MCLSRRCRRLDALPPLFDMVLLQTKVFSHQERQLGLGFRTAATAIPE